MEIGNEIPKEILVKELDQFRSDWWALSLMQTRAGRPPAPPRAAVRPRSTEEVSRVLQWASANSVPVVARGGGSGVCGSALPESDWVVVDLTAMSRVIAVDESALTVSAETGISGPVLEEALNVKGLTLAHIPQSFELSTLGGWIGTKATGQLSTKYGGIENNLLALTAVLSDGSIVSARASPRTSTGPDWWRLMVGSEGTLGIVTEATLSVFEIPQQRSWLSVRPRDFDHGLEMLRLLMRAGLRPAVARLYDEADAAATFARVGLGEGPLALLRFDGHPTLVAAESQIATKIIESNEGELIGPEAAEYWWEHRFRAADTYRRILSREGPLGPYGVVDTMEVATFWPTLPRLYRSVRSALAESADLVLAHASHLYTSGANIYFTFLISSAVDDENAETRYRSAWDAGMRATLASGGTISHHHGVGALKGPWMKDELGSGMEALTRIKRALDPSGVLNPGKLTIRQR